MEQLDCVVVGAGVVGLAVARALARAGREVIVLEAADTFGTGISSRSSGVIHAGLYYPPGTLKARLCREGAGRLYAYLADRGIDHRRTGKLVVATHPDQHPALARVEADARDNRDNQLDDLRRLTGDEARTLEPALHCTAALLSPSTGIVDSHGLMVALLADAQAAGATVSTRSPVLSGRITDTGVELEVGGGAPVRVRCRSVVNAAGLGATALARGLEGFPRGRVPTSYLCKGNYFTLGRRAPFRHLIYPVPNRAGLGIHLTLDLGGAVRFGPDVEWVEAEDYRVGPERAGAFEAAVVAYWPDLPKSTLHPDYAGLRPKIVGPGHPPADFRIDAPRQHGVPGLVHLFGIESPGLTACIALADEVKKRLGRV